MNLRLIVRNDGDYSRGVVVQRLFPQNRIFSSGFLVPVKSTLWVCCLWMWLGGVWCGVKVATGMLALGPLRRCSGVGQDQLLPVSSPVPPGMSYKMSCR